MVTLVERSSRFTLLAALPGGYTAAAAAEAVTAAIGRVPSHMSKTLTWDRGTEMARCVEQRRPELPDSEP